MSVFFSSSGGVEVCQDLLMSSPASSRWEILGCISSEPGAKPELLYVFLGSLRENRASKLPGSAMLSLIARLPVCRHY